MTLNLSEEEAKWLPLVDLWQKSGLTAAKWCRQKQIQYRIFMKWKRLFRPKNPLSKKRSREQFTELVDPPVETQKIELELNRVLIRIDSNFSEPLLLRCLDVLRRLEC